MASRVLGALAVTATAALATLAMATPASAHTRDWGTSCDAGAKATKVWVNLRAYADGGRNDVVVKDKDGTEVLKKDNFGKSHAETKDNLDATKDHTFTITVKAWDGYNFTDTKTVTKCVVKAPPTKSSDPKPPVSSSPEVPSSSVTPPSSSTPPAPGGSTPEPPLAATGASPMWLLLSGLGLVGAGAGTLLFLRRRRSA